MFQTMQKAMKLVTSKQFTQLKDKKNQGKQCAMNCVITLANKELETGRFMNISLSI
jgi:hypothetical protein